MDNKLFVTATEPGCNKHGGGGCWLEQDAAVGVILILGTPLNCNAFMLSFG